MYSYTVRTPTPNNCQASRSHVPVLADLYGRGYSDAPATTYDAALYATQLALLMQHVKWEKASIAGLSMVRLLLSAQSSDVY